jgi:hypothetical protein
MVTHPETNQAQLSLTAVTSSRRESRWSPIQKLTKPNLACSDQQQARVQMVTHPETNQARRSLTAVLLCELVQTTCYRRGLLLNLTLEYCSKLCKAFVLFLTGTLCFLFRIWKISDSYKLNSSFRGVCLGVGFMCSKIPTRYTFPKLLTR